MPTAVTLILATVSRHAVLVSASLGHLWLALMMVFSATDPRLALPVSDVDPDPLRSAPTDVTKLKTSAMHARLTHSALTATFVTDKKPAARDTAKVALPSLVPPSVEHCKYAILRRVRARARVMAFVTYSRVKRAILALRTVRLHSSWEKPTVETESVKMARIVSVVPRTAPVSRPESQTIDIAAPAVLRLDLVLYLALTIAVVEVPSAILFKCNRLSRLLAVVTPFVKETKPLNPVLKIVWKLSHQRLLQDQAPIRNAWRRTPPVLPIASAAPALAEARTADLASNFLISRVRRRPQCLHTSVPHVSKQRLTRQLLSKQRHYRNSYKTTTTHNNFISNKF